VDLVAGGQGIEVFGFVQVPQHGSSILSTRSTQRSIWRDGNSVDVASMTNVVGLKATGREFPNLDQLIPTRADNDRVLRIWAESDTRNPFRVTLLSDGELAVSESVPELDGAVSRSRDDLSVVCRKGDGENVVAVTNESAGGGTGGKLPEAKSLIPRGRESVGTIRGDHAVRDNVGVTVKGSLWISVLGFIAG